MEIKQEKEEVRFCILTEDDLKITEKVLNLDISENEKLIKNARDFNKKKKLFQRHRFCLLDKSKVEKKGNDIGSNLTKINIPRNSNLLLKFPHLIIPKDNSFSKSSNIRNTPYQIEQHIKEVKKYELIQKNNNKWSPIINNSNTLSKGNLKRNLYPGINYREKFLTYGDLENEKQSIHLNNSFKNCLTEGNEKENKLKKKTYSNQKDYKIILPYIGKR
jgi:hypothetical protein